MESAQYLSERAGVLVFVAIAVAPRLISMSFAVRSIKSSFLKNEKENSPEAVDLEETGVGYSFAKGSHRLEDTH